MFLNVKFNWSDQAISSLDEAKLNYQKQQYEHSLKVSDYQTPLLLHQEQIISLQTSLDKVDEELEQLTSVYSPYRGKDKKSEDTRTERAKYYC